MLLIQTLRNKPEYSKNGELIKDLTAKSVEFTGDIFVGGTVLVSDEMVMRADLIAKVYFSNSNKIDYLLKFNSISNPFAIDEGDILLIPFEQDMKNAFKPKTNKDKQISKEEIVKKFFDPDRLNKKDQKRLDFLKKKSDALANGSKTNLPPNFAEPGSKELKVVDGKVVFGGDVVANKEHCIDPLSKARAKSKLLQNKMFKNVK